MDDRSPHDAARAPEMTLPLDEDQLGRLVRAAVDDWKLPPQRLDGFTWRDRVAVAPKRVRPARLRGGAGGSVAAPLAAAAVLTVVALVATSFGVAWLNARPAPGASGTPGREATPSGHATARPQHLPEFAVSGTPLPTGSLVVQEDGVVKLLDVATGETAASLPDSWPGGTPYIYELPGGGYVHVNVATEEPWGSGEQGVVVTVRVLDARFRELELIEAARYAGLSGPVAERQPFGASAVPSIDPSGRYLFLGWSKRAATAWESGVDVFDLEQGRVVHELSLPSISALPGRTDTEILEVSAPVVQAQDGSFIGIARSTRDWAVIQSAGSEVPDLEERWSVVRDQGRFGEPQEWIDPKEGPGGCRRVLDEGFAAEVMYYVLCEVGPGDGRAEGGYLVRVQDLAEGGLQDVPLEGMEPDGSQLGTASRGSILWVWQASGAIAEVDLSDWTARTVPDIGVDRFESTTSDPLRQLARMLVPTALAKPWHEDGASRRLLVQSDDGSTLFALQPTIWDVRSGNVITAPPAVWVIDAASLQAIGHWPGLAAWESLQLSEDGRFLFLAAPAGLDSNGSPDLSWKASIVALDTSSGEARLILGREGEGGLMVGTDPLG